MVTNSVFVTHPIGALSLNDGVAFLLTTVQRKCKRAQSQVYLNYAECSLSSNDSAKIRLFSGTTKFWVAIRADFQQLSN